MKRARNERERRDGVSLCNAVSWWGKCFSSCGALERLPLSRANWAHRTRDLLMLHCPRNALMPVSCWAPCDLSAECRSSPWSPVRMHVVSTCQATGWMLDPLLPHSLLSRGRAGPFLEGQSRYQAPHRAVNTNSPTRTMVKPGPLIVSLVVFQQSDPEVHSPGTQCHRSNPPPILGAVSWARLGTAFTPELHGCRRQMT